MKKTLNILIVLGLLNILGGGLIWYGYSSIQDIKQTETDLRAQLVEENQKGQKLATLRQTLTSATRDREQLERYLIDSSDEQQIKLIARIERLGTTTGVQVTTSTFELQPLKNPIIHGDFSLNGSWTELYHFLRLIEEFPSRVVISRYDLHLAPLPNAPKSAADNWAGAISIDFASLKQNPS